MASWLEEDLTCPICCDIFRNPVVLSCSHSFCKVCLVNWWKDKPIKTCPVCKTRSSNEVPPLNLALKNLVQTFATKRDQEAAEPLCSIHSEKLRLFCLDHQQLICLVCRDSQMHKGHRISPNEEVISDLRKQLRTSITRLKDKLKVLTVSKEQSKDAAAHITAQTQQTAKQIQDQFAKLKQFLLEEEQSRMKALREEEQQKTQNMKDRIVAVSREIRLCPRPSQRQRSSYGPEHHFPAQFKTTVERVQRCSHGEDKDGE
ncbi:hypothetical protein WMY93_020721 [Mugilogobius chulae]|uniref:Uncharacterized protein n=1 Tax=Mugilogobius chulae TaxID=88201 RepID=A0AAW0NEG9_9GOBI